MMYNNNNPYGGFANVMQQPQLNNNIIKISNIESAKSYQMQPNGAVALFNDKENLFYIKTTDGAGFPTIRTFRFVEEETATPTPQQTEFVTKAEFENFKKEVLEYAKSSSTIPTI